MSAAAERAPLLRYVPEGAALEDSGAILDRFTAWVTSTGLTPYPAQEEALLELMDGKHVVLSTPTGSGKSLVALGLHFKALCEGRRSFYTAPIKALVSEKFFALCDVFGAENVGMLTGDAAINWAAPVICCTAEVLSNMTLRQAGATDAPYVVMDEFHYYADADRGVAWQVPLLTLPKTTFLLMSATLGNTAAIEERLRADTGREVAHVYSEDRPVPLDFEYRETTIHESVEELLAGGRAPVYVVSFTQRECAELAQALTSAKVTGKETRKKIAEALVDFRFDTPYGRDMRRFLSHGVGLHHAGLLPKYRLLVEQLAQQGLLRVICGTDTLGVGVNIPIRTVLLSKLCKFDGEKVRILSARDFKQIVGRAGRKGFDDHGSVVCQAPGHVVQNKRSEERNAKRGKGRKAGKAKPPPRGFVSWSRDTFEQLQKRPPETLRSSFRVTHGMMVAVLQREVGEVGPRGGYGDLVALVDRSHESPARKARLHREAAALFRALRHSGIVATDAKPGRAGRKVRVDEALQRDFSLHHTLSLYLVDAAASLDADEEGHALDVLSLVEAVLENPMPILRAQVHKAKGALVAKLKAERVPYEERMERLDEVTWPKPNEEFIYATFKLFTDRHPWVGAENIRPKSVAREMVEGYARFDSYVKSYELQRIEGLLLRYLGQVYTALDQTVPEAQKTDDLQDILAYLRATIARVDSSLLQEWESLIHPERRRQAPSDEEPPARPLDLALTPRAFRARVRSEMHSLVRALADRDYEEAARWVAPEPADPGSSEPWTPQLLEEALAPFYSDHERVRFDPDARGAHYCRLEQTAPRVFEVNQVLCDPDGENDWFVEGIIDLRGERAPEGPLVRLRRIGV